jgi:pullulanase/glycogen debranching enzyme
MTESDWREPRRQCLGVLLDRTGVDVRHRDPSDRHPGGSFLLLFNASAADVEFTLPAPISADRWEVAVDTRQETVSVPTDGYRTDHVYSLAPHSLVLLGEPR